MSLNIPLLKKDGMKGNGYTTSFQLSHTPVKTPIVYVNGIETSNFEIIGSTLVFRRAPKNSAVILVTYEYKFSETEYGTDLKVEPVVETSVIEAPSDLDITPGGDIQLVSGIDNLKQAMINRIRTRQGELMLHLTYGSILFLVYGKPNTDMSRRLIENYVLSALIGDPRIGMINTISCTEHPSNKNEAVLHLNVTPINQYVPLNLVYPFRLY